MRILSGSHWVSRFGVGVCVAGYGAWQSSSVRLACFGSRLRWIYTLHQHEIALSPQTYAELGQ